MQGTTQDGRTLTSESGHGGQIAPPRFHHVGVQTTDVANSVAWYSAFFSAVVSWRLDTFSEITEHRLPGISELVEVRAGAIRFHIFGVASSEADRTPAACRQFQHFCLEVPSWGALQQWRERWLRLRDSRRFVFGVDEAPTEIVEDDDGVHSFYALDVNGLEYEFTWLGSASDRSDV